MDPQREIPEYRLVEPAFFEPNLLPKGSTIKWDGEPGNHLEPLNEAAYLRLEEWYNFEVDEIDPKTMKPTGLKLRPRMKFKSTIYNPAAVHEATVMALPEPRKETAMSLTESLNTHKPTPQRPPPSMEKREVWSPPSEQKAGAEVAPPPKPALEVTGVGKPDLPEARKVG